MTEPKYKRCVLKVSGESLAGEAGFGIDPATLDALAAEIAEISRLGVELALVCGGGNIWRGLKGAKGGMDRSTADYMGMLATVINALALQSAIQAQGVSCCVQTAIPMPQIAEPYIRPRALNHLKKGTVVIFAAGLGNPFFSTDTAAALRAAEINAEAILMAKKVDGVYDDDPKTNPNAQMFHKLSLIDVVSKGLKVMDSTAASLCNDNNIPIIVFNITVPGNMLKAVMGEDIGTTLGGENDD